MISPTAWQNAPDATTDQERDDWAGNNPVGTGPFKFVDWQKSTKQVYTKFENYWQDGKPYLDGIELDFIADPMTASAAFQAEEVDILWNPPIPIAKQLEGSGYNIVKLQTGLGSHINGLVPNSTNPDSPFTDIKLRQALSYAIDREAICNGVFSGYAVPMQQWAMPDSVWYCPDVKGYAYDPEKAKQLVIDAGYPDGIEAKILTLNFPDMVGMSTAVQDMLSKVGINAELDVADIGRFLQETTAPKQWESLVVTGFAVVTDPCPQMAGPLLRGPYLSAGMEQPDEIKELLAKAVTVSDEEKHKLIQQVQKLTFDEYCLFAPIEVAYGLAAKQEYVKNDNMCTVMTTQWTPEDAMIDK
jgi:peptide/nickel transport system substrate-binding protein